MENNNNKVPIGIWVFHAVWIIAVVIGVSAVILRAHQNRWIYIQTVVNALALAAVAITALFALRTQQAMVRQTTISIMPLFNVSIVIKYGAREPWDPSSRYNVFIQNIGNGVGLNIEIDPLYVKHDFDGKEAIDKLWFSRIVHLGPKNDPIAIKDFVEFDAYLKEVMVTDKERPDLVAFLIPEKIKGKYEMKLRYMDVLGNRYIQTINFDKSGNWPGKAIPIKAKEKDAASHSA